MALVEIVVSVIAGIVVGVGGTAIVMHKEPSIPIQTHQGTEQAIKQLTELDLTEPVCSPEYIQLHGNLLCREKIHAKM